MRIAALFLGAAALLLLFAVCSSASAAEQMGECGELENSPPCSPVVAAPPFQPWQEVWQCNDIRVTVTSRSPYEIEYDLGGMIWGGSRFTVVRGNLFFNGRPCVPLRPVGY